MAGGKARNKQTSGKIISGGGGVENNRNLRADGNSTVVGGIYIQCGVSWQLMIGHSYGYTVEKIFALLIAITSTFQPKPFNGRCLYERLIVFEEEDAELFFGRERSVEISLTV